MNKSNNKMTAAEKFQFEPYKALDHYYSNELSRRIKAVIKAKKQKLQCKEK